MPLHRDSDTLSVIRTVPNNAGRRLLRAISSVRAAVLLTVVVGIAIPNGLALIDEIDRLRDEHETAVHDDLGRITTLLAKSMREPMWQIAPEHATSIIDAAFIDERVVSIQVRDYQQRLFASQEKSVSDSEETVVHTRPIERDGQHIGVVMVEMSTSGYQQKLSAVIDRYMRRSLIGLIGSLLFIAAILHFRLVRPIDRLVDASARLAQGELEQPIEIRRNDELGGLANSLETTRRAIAGLIRKLELQNTELINANDLLESRVTERTRALKEAIDTLQRAQKDMVESEKLASLGRIVAGVAHELNTPIGNALTVATTLHEHLQPLSAEFAAGQVKKSTLSAALDRTGHGFDILLRSLGKAAQMIGDFKQVAVDQTSEKRRFFDLAEVTADVLATIQPAFKKTPFRIVQDLAPDIACDSYPGPYGQVLTNLVMNGLLHAFEGRSEGCVTVRVDSPKPGLARLQVSDDGVGMEESTRRKIFDPFFTTRLGAGGSGLGMNIVLSIVVRIMRGSIAVDSHPGKGSRFVVEFPCSPAETPVDPGQP